MGLGLATKALQVQASPVLLQINKMTKQPMCLVAGSVLSWRLNNCLGDFGIVLSKTD